jgi:hypothetical protein
VRPTIPAPRPSLLSTLWPRGARPGGSIHSLFRLLKALAVVALLATPLLVIAAMPRLFDLAGPVSTPRGQPAPTALSPAFRGVDATPSGARRVAGRDDIAPPTLAPPAATETPVATPRPTPTGEQVVIGNTGGMGAVLRADPVTGRPVAALREQQILEVLERRNIPGSGDWVRVRTADGAEGWVTALAAQPVRASNR